MMEILKSFNWLKGLKKILNTILRNTSSRYQLDETTYEINVVYQMKR
ncbi:hypothetical protein [Streptococcus mitis]